MTLEIQVMAWDRHKNGIEPVNGIPTLSLLITGSPTAIYK
jgi:hypothetical protein